MAAPPNICSVSPAIVENRGCGFVTPGPETKQTAPTNRRSIIDRLEAVGAIQSDSKAWLTGATDPFHDFEFWPSGLPDDYVGNTVVQVIKERFTIAAPTGLPAGKKWDVHISVLPLLSSIAGFAADVLPAEILGDDDAAILNLGTVQWASVESGKPTWPNAAAYTWVGPLETKAVSPSGSGNTGCMMRLIGGAYEVHNDTPELYKGGAVTNYVQQQDEETKFQVTRNLTASARRMSLVQSFKAPPSTYNEAAKLPNSVTYEAAQGCLVPIRMDLKDTNFRQATTKVLCLSNNDVSGSIASPSGYGVATAITGTEAHFTINNRVQSLHTSGSYFSGLSPETTLTLEVRFIMEVAPMAKDTTLVSLASPTAAYDPEVLELYTKIMRELPAGVPVSMNAKGDWWKMIIDTVAKVAPIVGPVLGALGPYGAVASGVTSGLGNLAQNAQQHYKSIEKDIKEEKKKRKQQQSLKPANQARKPARK